MTGINDDGSIDKESGVRVIHARAMELEDQVEKLIAAGSALCEAADNVEHRLDAGIGHDRLLNAMTTWSELLHVIRT